MQTISRTRGFTLIELLVVVAIVSILATVAMPDFSATIKNDRNVSELNSLLNGLNLARSEAIKTGMNVSVCAGSDVNCNGTSWADGWVVFYNSLPAGISNPIIKAFPPINSGSTFTSDGSYNFTFQDNGTLTPTPASPVNFTLCDPRGATSARSINLAPFGRAVAAAKPGYQIDGTTALTCP